MKYKVVEYHRQEKTRKNSRHWGLQQLEKESWVPRHRVYFPCGTQSSTVTKLRWKANEWSSGFRTSPKALFVNTSLRVNIIHSCGMTTFICMNTKVMHHSSIVECHKDCSRLLFALCDTNNYVHLVQTSRHRLSWDLSDIHHLQPATGIFSLSAS